MNDAYWKGQLLRMQVHSNVGWSVTARCRDSEELLGAAMKTLLVVEVTAFSPKCEGEFEDFSPFVGMFKPGQGSDV